MKDTGLDFNERDVMLIVDPNNHSMGWFWSGNEVLKKKLMSVRQLLNI